MPGASNHSGDGSPDSVRGCWLGGVGENGFRHHDMHALVVVHQLGDVDVAGHADQHVGVVAAYVLVPHEEVDHAGDRLVRGDGKVVVEAHADVVRGCFGVRVGPGLHT